MEIFTLVGSCRASASTGSIASNDRVLLAGLTAPINLPNSAAVCQVNCGEFYIEERIIEIEQATNVLDEN